MLLQTRDLSVAFGGIRAVDAVNFALPSGQIRALIGPNGAGKTTFFNAVSGRYRPTTGSIVFDGTDITGLAPRKIVRLGLVRTFQISSVFPGLTVFENVWVARNAQFSLFRAVTSAPTRRELAEQTRGVLDTLGLGSLAAKTASALSYGDQRVLEIAIALALRPKLLLLDEPTAGMSPAETERAIQLVRRLRSEVTIVIVEHDMDLIMGLADVISVFDRGQLIVEGAPDEIRANETVRRIYLGEHCMLTVAGLNAYYGKSHVVRGISFEVAKGSVIGLLGRNGVGKTTTLRGMMGLVNRTGAIKLDGRELGQLPSHRISRFGLAYIPQGRDLFPHLTVEENLRLAWHGSEFKDEDLQRGISHFPPLSSMLRRIAGTLSGGEQQMVAVGRALLNNPPAILMDEPAEGLSPLFSEKVAEIIGRIKGMEIAVVLVEQNLSLALNACDRVCFIEKGQVAHACTGQEARSPELLERYLGVGLARAG